jgi:hypothetical protein
MTLENLFKKHGLVLSRLCDQGYDEASNMSGEFNGFKTLIMSENNSTHLSTLNSMIILFLATLDAL